MQLLYNIAAILVVILIIPVFMIRAIRERGFVQRIKQQVGFIPKSALEKVANKNCIWVHAASVGEIVAASPLIREFHKEFPKTPILVSVVTNSGYEMANRIIKDADSIIYFPLDLPWLSGHVLRRVMPRIFMPVETELWPNFLKAARELHIPAMMVNGRISEKSVKRYHHLHSILDDMIRTVKTFAMQSSIDAEYIKQLGAPPELVTVTGNTKFDQTYTEVTPEEKLSMIQEMGLGDNDGIFLAGSTHKGEEVFVLDAFKELRKEFPKAKLVIAPRELLRVSEILSLCKKYGFNAKRRTELQQNLTTDHDIVILDTIGELGRVYSIGDVIYVGGSLIPHGGHNILEPAAHGKAIIVGYNMFNFKETHELFSKRDACITVNNSSELTEQVLNLFRDSDLRNRMEKETLAICSENKGAARRTAVLLRKLLESQETESIKATEKVENFQTYFFHLLHDNEKHGFGMKLLIKVLYVFSILYGGLVNLKLLGYKVGIFKRKKLDCYVISLGNITVGGTGKTPTAQRLAKDIHDMGYRVVILNRGYRAKWRGDVGIVSNGRELLMSAPMAGDEAYMLAKHLPEVPVLIGPDRAVTGKYAIEHFGAEVAILDDGYQHWQLKRDMDIVLIDSVNVFGNNYMLPRGTLREPIPHLERADVCLLTKVDQAAAGSLEYIHDTISKYDNKALVVESIHQPRAFVELSDWYANIGAEGIPVSKMKGKRMVAVSAIGNPTSFEQTLKDLGVMVLESLRFPDHHDYTEDEMHDVMDQAIREDAEAIVITEKDAVKIPVPDVSRSRGENGVLIPIYVLCVEVTFLEGGRDFRLLLQDKLDKQVHVHEADIEFKDM